MDSLSQFDRFLLSLLFKQMAASGMECQDAETTVHHLTGLAELAKAIEAFKRAGLTEIDQSVIANVLRVVDLNSQLAR